MLTETSSPVTTVSMTVFPEHALAHQLLDDLHGLEIGAAAHNPFGLNARNVAPPDDYEFYASSQAELGVAPAPVHIWATADAIPIPDDSEDFILSSHVVEHLPNVIGTFVEWNRIVKPGGFVFMIVPLRDAHPADRQRPLTTLEHLIDDYHKRYNLDTHPTDGVPGGRMGHYHVLTPEILLDAVVWMNDHGLTDWEFVAREDVDSKVGNGFTLAFRVCSKPAAETKASRIVGDARFASALATALPPLEHAPTRIFGIIGTFDVDNYGDLLFPVVLERSMQRVMPGARLRLISSHSGTYRFDGRPIYSLQDLATHSDGLDGFVFGGGDIVRFDRVFSGTPEAIDFEELLVTSALCAANLGRPFVWNAPGVPREFTQTQRGVVQAACALSDYVSVRDERSRSFLPVDDSRFAVVPDTGFLISQIVPRALLDRIVEDLRRRCSLPPSYIAAHLSPATANSGDVTVAARELRALSDSSGLPIVLLPLGPVHGEEDFLSRVRDMCPERFQLAQAPLHSLETAALIARARAFISTSLHGNITAFAFDVPATAVNTRDLAKLRRFGELTGRPVLSSWTQLSQRTDTLENAADAAQRHSLIRAQLDEHLRRLAEALVGASASRRTLHDTDDRQALLKLICSRHSADAVSSASIHLAAERQRLESELRDAREAIAEHNEKLIRQGERLAHAEAGVREKECALQAMQRIVQAERNHLGWWLLQTGRAMRDRLFPRSSWRWKLYRGLRAPLHFLLKPSTRTAFARFFGSFRLGNRDGLRRKDLRRMKGRCKQMRYRPLISVVTPVYNVDAAWLREAIDSVRGQVYPHWELCLVNDASTASHIQPLLDKYAERDPRIRVLHLEQNSGISGASNRALEIAAGEFVALLDHDDVLAPHALYEVAEALNRDPALDLIYSDEDKITAGGHCYDPVLKPDWDPLLLLTCNYVCHLSVYRTELLRELGGFRSEFDGSQDYDLVLRVGERTDRVAHIPKTLYHWRVIESSTASSPTAKPYAYAAARTAIEQALARRGRAARVETRSPGQYRVHHPVRLRTKVSILVDCPQLSEARLRLFERLFRRTSGPLTCEFMLLSAEAHASKPDWPAAAGVAARSPHATIGQIYNDAARSVDGDYLVFLDGCTEPMQADWLTTLFEQMQPEVAAAGARIVGTDGRVLHSGFVINADGNPRSASSFLRGPSINRLLYTDAPRRCSAVGGGCLLVSRADFDRVGGFDARFKRERHDIDLCLRLRESGRQIVYTPWSTLQRVDAEEPATIPFDDHKLFNELWQGRLPARDPFCHGKVMNLAG